MDAKRRDLVESEIQVSYESMYPRGDRSFVPRAFASVTDWFGGSYMDYLPIDVQYHDLEHTLQGVLCLVRLLARWRAVGKKPFINQRMFELGMLAILMHDSGYLKKRGDSDGTGAKYTLVHVDRSVAFAAEFMRLQGCPEPEICSVQNMIRCTGLNNRMSAIAFQTEAEKLVGCALGTADLLGQMAAPDYVDKLPILYSEFEEMARCAGNTGAPGGFTSAEDLIRKTPAFWEKFVVPKLQSEFGGVANVLADPYPDGANPYFDAINANIALIRRRLAAS